MNSSNTGVNYEAFTSPLKVSKKWLYVGVASTGLMFPALICADAVNHSHPDNIAATLLALTTLICFIGFLAGFFIYSTQKNTARGLRFFQLLSDNGWSLTLEPGLEHVATSLLGIGNYPGTGVSFAGKYRGVDMYAVTYKFETGSGKSRQVHSFTNLYFYLGGVFPLMVLDDKKNDELFSVSDLPERIKGGQALKLEGDFNDRFKVTVLPGSEREVLQLLTPDFMQEMYQTPAKANVEIEADKLFIITKSNEFSLQNLQNLFGMADVVLKNISEVSDTWQASSSPQTIETMAVEALTPRAHALTKRKGVSIGAILIVVFYVAVMLLTSGD